MISLSAPQFDLDGQLISYSGSAIPRNISRRAVRVATLDGGATLVDGGYADCDLTFDLNLADTTGDHHQTITGLIRNYQYVVLSVETGCFRVLLSALENSRGETTCTAEVLERLC